MFRCAPGAIVVSLLLAAGLASEPTQAGIIIDHGDTDLTELSAASIKKAKTDLHIAYGHTSHGSQLVDGMRGLVGFANGGGLGLSYPDDFFDFNNGGSDGALDLHDGFKSGDLGNPDRTTWAARTRDYLGLAANSDVNVVIWSWCGQADTSGANINLYLDTMSQLENDYADVNFVYMTGHVNGCSTTENLFYRNQQIRDYCTANDKILYDFADIESWDPDGKYFGDKLVTDDCYYDSDDNGSRDRNWALDWQNGHEEGTDWYDVYCAHSRALNGNRKAYAAWALWTEIALALHTPGDADKDDDVDFGDFNDLANHYTGALSPGAGDKEWHHGDFDDDGDVDFADFNALANHYTGEQRSGKGEPMSFVPEPSSFALLAAGVLGLWLLGRRRKNGVRTESDSA